MPRWFLGKHLTSLTVAGGTKANGVVTYGAANSLTHTVDYISVERLRTHDQIMPVNAGKVHNEGVLLDSNFALGEIKTLDGSVLQAIADAYDFAQATATMADGKVYVCQGSIGRLGDGVKAMGKNTDEMSCLQYDDGVGGGVSLQ